LLHILLTINGGCILAYNCKSIDSIYHNYLEAEILIPTTNKSTHLFCRYKHGWKPKYFILPERPKHLVFFLFLWQKNLEPS